MNEFISILEEKLEQFFEEHTTNRRVNKNISKKILSIIEGRHIRVQHNKLYFTYDNWKILDKYQYIKERRQKVHLLVNQLIRHKIIHSKSDPFPKNLRLYSINSLPTHFLNTYLPNLDSMLDFKKKIIDTLSDCSIYNLEMYIYLYISL